VPTLSSALRIASTRPFHHSEGATTSAPVRQHTALGQQPRWVVLSRNGRRRPPPRRSAHATCTRSTRPRSPPESSVRSLFNARSPAARAARDAPVPCSSSPAAAEQQQAAEGQRPHAAASFTASSIERLNTPGIEPISLRTPSPGQRNSGYTALRECKCVSRTRTASPPCGQRRQPRTKFMPPVYVGCPGSPALSESLKAKLSSCVSSGVRKAVARAGGRVVAVRRRRRQRLSRCVSLRCLWRGQGRRVRLCANIPHPIGEVRKGWGNPILWCSPSRGQPAAAFGVDVAAVVAFLRVGTFFNISPLVHRIRHSN